MNASFQIVMDCFNDHGNQVELIALDLSVLSNLRWFIIIVRIMLSSYVELLVGLCINYLVVWIKWRKSLFAIHYAALNFIPAMSIGL